MTKAGIGFPQVLGRAGTCEQRQDVLDQSAVEAFSTSVLRWRVWSAALVDDASVGEIGLQALVDVLGSIVAADGLDLTPCLEFDSRRELLERRG